MKQFEVVAWMGARSREYGNAQHSLAPHWAGTWTTAKAICPAAALLGIFRGLNPHKWPQ
jgi:hypothetical protein